MTEAVHHKIILVAEDNDANLFVIKAMLKRAGYNPLVARDGMEAVELTLREHPRLVLMDISMPRMNGVDAALRIRDLANGSAPAIVAVTANATDRQREACAAAGFDGFIAKPVDQLELLDVVACYVT